MINYYNPSVVCLLVCHACYIFWRSHSSLALYIAHFLRLPAFLSRSCSWYMRTAFSPWHCCYLRHKYCARYTVFAENESVRLHFSDSSLFNLIRLNLSIIGCFYLDCRVLFTYYHRFDYKNTMAVYKLWFKINLFASVIVVHCRSSPCVLTGFGL